MFSAFGESEIEVFKAGDISPMDSTQSYGSHAIVSFQDALAAVCAQQFLNNQYLAKYKALLSVKVLVENSGNRRTSMQEGLMETNFAKSSMARVRPNSAAPFSR